MKAISNTATHAIVAVIASNHDRLRHSTVATMAIAVAIVLTRIAPAAGEVSHGQSRLSGVAAAPS